MVAILEKFHSKSYLFQQNIHSHYKLAHWNDFLLNNSAANDNWRPDSRPKSDEFPCWNSYITLLLSVGWKIQCYYSPSKKHKGTVIKQSYKNSEWLKKQIKNFDRLLSSPQIRFPHKQDIVTIPKNQGEISRFL